MLWTGVGVPGTFQTAQALGSRLETRTLPEFMPHSPRTAMGQFPTRTVQKREGPEDVRGKGKNQFDRRRVYLLLFLFWYKVKRIAITNSYAFIIYLHYIMVFGIARTFWLLYTNYRYYEMYRLSS